MARDIRTSMSVASAMTSNIQSKAAGLSGNAVVRIAGGSTPAIEEGNTAASELMQLFSEAGGVISRDAAKIMKVDEEIRREDLRASGLMGSWEKMGS